MPLNILFRVDAGESVGLGHLMRCLALAQTLETNEIRSHFLVSSESAEICKHRKDWVGKLHILPQLASLKDEIVWLKSFSKSVEFDGLVVDGYCFSSEYRQALTSLAVPIICFDDMNNSGQLWADLIINGAGNANQLGYQLSEANAILCLGEKYRVMRQEFFAPPSLAFSERDSLLVTMGGSDPNKLSLPLLKKLESLDFKGTISLVTGAANSEINEINDFVNNTVLKVTHFHDCQTMSTLMCRSRLAISAAGGSQFELLACACPSLLVVVADNQTNATQEAKKQGWCETFDGRLTHGQLHTPQHEKRVKIGELGELAMHLWQTPAKLETMHQNAKAKADRQGAQRVVSRIKELLICE